MATDSMDRVRTSQQAVLEPGEYFTAAIRMRWKTGVLGFLGPVGWVAALSKRRQPDDFKLPTEGIVAVTSSRLLVFESDRGRRVKPTKLRLSLPLGDQAFLAGTSDPEKSLGAGSSWTYLTLVLAGREVELEVPVDEVDAFMHAMRGYGPRARRAHPEA